MAEGTRLLSEYGEAISIAGSNPALSAWLRLHSPPLSAPVAQLDRASVYGTEGQRFESSRARYTSRTDDGGVSRPRQPARRRPPKDRNPARDPLGKRCVLQRIAPGRCALSASADSLGMTKPVRSAPPARSCAPAAGELERHERPRRILLPDGGRAWPRPARLRTQAARGPGCDNEQYGLDAVVQRTQSASKRCSQAAGSPRSAAGRMTARQEPGRSARVSRAFAAPTSKERWWARSTPRADARRSASPPGGPGVRAADRSRRARDPASSTSRGAAGTRACLGIAVDYSASEPNRGPGAEVAARLLVLKPTYKRHWTIPGGQLEADGETPWQACRRETREECGIEIERGRVVCDDFRRGCRQAAPIP